MRRTGRLRPDWQVTPAAAATGGPPDLMVAISAPSPVLVNSQFSYTLKISNPSYEACAVQRPNCEAVTMGSTATNVTLTDTLPPGLTVLSLISADSGFFCSEHTPGNVVCTGGTIPRDGVATITLNVRAPGTATVLTDTATVDPSNRIAERNETNNTASLNTLVNFPPSDLSISSFTQSTPSQHVGGYETSTIGVHNAGPGPAWSIQVYWDANWNNGMPGNVPVATLSGDSGFECQTPQTGSTGQHLFCPGGAIPAGGTAWITINVLGSSTPLTTTATVTVDPNNIMAETNENNNQATLTTSFY